MRVRRKFIQLTKFTYPFGTEHQLEKYLPKGYKMDEHGNYFLKIGDTPSTMFTCHLDTACQKQEKVKHVLSSDRFITTDGSTILGADDKAGMVVLLSLIENKVPGLYYFFIGEEVGCIGSNALSKTWLNTDYSKYITKCVSFDRRGTKSVITHQLYGRCASDVFANELSKRLNSVGDFNFSPDPTGILTDSVNFIDFVPECTNISVGYYNEHGGSEMQDIQFLRELSKAVCKIDWETLPVARDVFEYEYDDDEDDDFEFDEDDDFDSEWSEDNYSYFKVGKESKKMYISTGQIVREIGIINNWLRMSCAYPGFDRIEWNGNSLRVGINGVMVDVGDRYDLTDIIPELMEVSRSQVRESIKKKRKSYTL